MTPFKSDAYISLDDLSMELGESKQVLLDALDGVTWLPDIKKITEGMVDLIRYDVDSYKNGVAIAGEFASKAQEASVILFLDIDGVLHPDPCEPKKFFSFNRHLDDILERYVNEGENLSPPLILIHSRHPGKTYKLSTLVEGYAFRLPHADTIFNLSRQGTLPGKKSPPLFPTVRPDQLGLIKLSAIYSLLALSGLGHDFPHWVSIDDQYGDLPRLKGNGKFLMDRTVSCCSDFGLSDQRTREQLLAALRKFSLCSTNSAQ